MSRIIGILLILVGGWLIYRGHSEAESLAGKTRTTITDVKNSIDGKGRIATQYWYYGAGAVLIGAGVVTGLRRRS